MTFDEWYKGQNKDHIDEISARLAWNVSAQMERSACAAITERVCREHAVPKAGYAAAKEIISR